MKYREFHYRWEYSLKSSPQSLWPFVSDTNRFNRDSGLPAVDESGRTSLPNARRRLGFVKFGIPVEWEELPFEWVYPFRFGVIRRYLSGPIAEMRVLVEMSVLPGGGTRLAYDVRVQPGNFLGLMGIPIQIGQISARGFAATFQKYDRLAAAPKPPLYISSTPRFAEGGLARLHSLKGKLLDEGLDPRVIQNLAELLKHADDLTIARIRSHVLADHWEASRRSVLETMLWATRLGLLDLRWDIICPLCRGAKQTASSINQIKPQVHCDTCNVDFNVNFDRAVELTFRPNPAVRKVDIQEYCVGGPRVTPHIVAQQLLSPGERRELEMRLEPGRYRLRTLNQSGGYSLKVEDEGLFSIVVSADEDGWPAEEAVVCSHPRIVLENSTANERLFILERLRWSDQVTTAAEVTSLQVFRDLFSSEALRPGEMISVGSLTVLFTDLRNSTKMYREIGDSTAFGRVMSHFDVLREAIALEEGALVKTIGDAVMGVFRRPAAGLRAMLNAQDTLAQNRLGKTALLLKAGLHSGPCIAVTLNERLDYFGTTVNMAARLEGLSTGSDVIVSDAVYRDIEVQEMLADEGQNIMAEVFDVPLKGFAEERFTLWRIARREASACI